MLTAFTYTASPPELVSVTTRAGAVVLIDCPPKSSELGAIPMLPGPVAVVVVKVPATPPIVSVVVTSLLGVSEDTWRTHTVCPGSIVPGVVTKVAVQPMEYSPPATEIAVPGTKLAGVTTGDWGGADRATVGCVPDVNSAGGVALICTLLTRTMPR